MATEQDTVRKPLPLPDPAKLAEAWTNVLVNGTQAIRSAAERGTASPAPPPFDPFAPAQAFSDLAKSL